MTNSALVMMWIPQDRVPGILLTRSGCGRCTKHMALASATKKSHSLKQSGTGLGRLLRHRYFGWRRIATGVAGGLAVSLAYHVIFGQNGLTVYEHKRNEAKELAREQIRLSQENEFFRGHVARLQSDPNAIEHQAREELHYTRPGEVIYTLPAASAPTAQVK